LNNSTRQCCQFPLWYSAPTGNQGGRSQHTFPNNGYPAWYNLSVSFESAVQYFNWFLAVKHRFVALGGWTGTGPSVRGSEVQKTVLSTEHSLRHFKKVQTCFIGPSQIYHHAGLLNFTEGPWHQILNRHSSQILSPTSPFIGSQFTWTDSEQLKDSKHTSYLTFEH
jgi:hypothetical protein